MRAGFFLGDAAGVGKGRTIAACMKEHFVAGHGTRALWVSVSKDLNFDAQRDLDDVHADSRVFPEVKPSQPPMLLVVARLWRLLKSSSMTRYYVWAL
jgi:hypothetical protein